jgi:hypothetical protein
MCFIKEEKSGDLHYICGLKMDDSTKPSFHLNILRSNNVIERDSEKTYILTLPGKKLMESITRFSGYKLTSLHFLLPHPILSAASICIQGFTPQTVFID